VRTNGGDLDNLYVDSRNQLTNAYLNSGHGNYDFTFDSNGNLTLVSIDYFATAESYFYDDENRLVFFTHTESGPPINWWDAPRTGSDRITEFHYDGLGRLRERLEYVAEGSEGSFSWSLPSSTRYIYDGWRVIQERDVDNTPTVSYTRGTDMSGTLEGAGGIGGLLARSHGYSGGNWSTHNFYHADGNGNITYLETSAQGLAASYRYDPFGNALNWSGSLADENVYRFSSKEFHAATGLYYYGYRWYSPYLQRWINRDPLEEEGGHNLYQFVQNAPIGKVDLYGLEIRRGTDGPPPSSFTSTGCYVNIECILYGWTWTIGPPIVIGPVTIPGEITLYCHYKCTITEVRGNCPSCDRVGADAGYRTTKTQFSGATPKPYRPKCEKVIDDSFNLNHL
jgi:RHS repeat-associated protein